MEQVDTRHGVENVSEVRGRRQRAATCPHCAAGFAQELGAVGTRHECTSCGGLSVTLEPGRRPVPLARRLSRQLTVADLPAPDAQGRVVLEGFWLDGTLELAELDLAHPLVLHRCVIAPPTEPHDRAAINLRRSRLAADLTLIDTLILGPLDLHDTTLAGSLVFRNVHVTGELDASGLCVGGDAHAWNLVCAGLANFHQCRFEGDTALRECHFREETNFNDVTFAGEANLSCSSFHGPCDFGGSDMSGGAEFYSTTFHGPADFTQVAVFAWTDFTASHFVSSLGFHAATFHNGVEFSNARFDGEADFSRAAFQGDVSFTHAHAYGTVGFAGANFEGKADFRHTRLFAGCDFSGARFNDTAFFQSARLRGVVRMNQANIAGQLRLEHARLQLEGEESESAPAGGRVAAHFGASGHAVEMQGVRVGGEFVLDGAHIGAALLLDKLDLNDGLSMQGATFEAELSLQGAVVAGAVRANHSVFCGPVHMAEATLGSGILARGIRAHDLWNMSDTKITAPSSFSQSIFTGRNQFDRTKIRGRFDITGASFTEKLDLTLVQFDANLRLDGLRAELLIIQRHQVEGRLESEMHARRGGELGRYWRDVAREYGILKRSFRMQGQYVDMDWAHHRYCQSDRKARTYEAFNPDPDSLKHGTARRSWLGYWFERSIRNPFEKVLVDWTCGYGTRPIRVLVTMLFAAVLFMPAYYGMEQSMLTAEPEETNTLTLADAYFVALGAQFAVGVDRIVVMPEVGRRVWGMIGVFVGLGLLTLFISTLSRKMIQ